MSISNRLLLGFGVVIVMMTLLGLYGLSQVARVRETMDRMLSRDFAMISELSTIYEGQAESSSASQEAVRLGLAGLPQPADLDRAEQGYRAGIAKMTGAINKASALAEEYGSTALSADRAAAWTRNGDLLRQMNTLLQTVIPQRDQQFAAIRAGRASEAGLQEIGLGQRRAQILALIE